MKYASSLRDEVFSKLWRFINWLYRQDFHVFDARVEDLHLTLTCRNSAGSVTVNEILETAKCPWRTIRETFPFSTFLKNSNNRVPTSSHSFISPAEKSFWICQQKLHVQIFTVLICRTWLLLSLNQHTIQPLVRQLLVRVLQRNLMNSKVQGNLGLLICLHCSPVINSIRCRERNL